LPLRCLLPLLLLLACLSPLPAGAFDVAQVQDEEVNLWPQAQVMRDPEARLGIADAAGSPLFAATRDESGNFGFTGDALWVRVRVRNSSAEARHFLLRVGRPNLDSIRLYLPAEAGGWRQLETGDHVPFRARPYPFFDPVFPVEVPPGYSGDWYLRIASTSSIWIPLRLESEEAFTRMAAAVALRHGVLFGVIGILAFYNLILYFSIRDRGYLYYSLTAAFQTGFFLSLMGYANQYLWPDAGWWADRATNLFASLSLLTGVLFLRHFLDTRRQAPRWDRVLFVGQLLMAALVFITLFAPFRIAAILLVSLAGVFVVTAIPFSAWLWRRGSRAGGWYLVSWAGYLLVLGYRVLELFGVLPMALGDSAFELAIGVTMVLLSFALVDQVNQLRREKEAAQADAFRTQLAATEELEREVGLRTQALSEATEAARAASRAKSEFVAMVSHEIRNPLTATLGNARLLRDTPLLPEQRALVAGMEQGSAQVLMLLNDLLDLARIESGELHVEHVAFSLPELITSTVAATEALLAGKQVALRCDTGRAPPWVWGDPRRVRQVLLNLVGNAIRFTDEGEIVISLDLLAEDATGVTVCITVTDTGIGIPSHKLDRLFLPFSQLHARLREGGTGLGLFICKQLVEAMGGEIGVESAPGEGSSFWFTLDFERAAEPERPRPEAARPRSLSILLVEDLPASRQIVAKLLQRDGHRVNAVASGEEAVAAVRHGAFDLVLMDLQMPGIGGLEATRRIRALPGRNEESLPIYAFTANVLERTADECRAAGMNGIVPKPLDPEFLKGELLHRFGAERAAPTVAAAAEAPIDVAVLDGRLELLGRKDMEEVIASYLENGAATVRDIEKAESAGRPAEVARLAHRLAGAADTVGLQSVSALARRLEAQFEMEPAAGLRRAVEGIRAAHHAGVEALLEWATSRGAVQSRATRAPK
jgi:signal transduction histidine kinase/HPt (histidine-containing phosphotransfer) domain-containing protein/ActR/RegA family two-component response regulator